MAHAHIHPAARSAAAQHYLKRSAQAVQRGLLAELDPLAEAIGVALVRSIGLVPSKQGRQVAVQVQGKDTLVLRVGAKLDSAHVPARLHEHLKRVIAEALSTSLCAQTELGTQLRMALVGRLASLQSGASPQAVLATTAAGDDEVLTTAQAAALLEVSRPYFSMLCDAGKLGEVLKTEGGHRRVSKGAVEAYRAAQTQTVADAVSPRAAAMEAGLYAKDDSEYVKAGQLHADESMKPLKRAPKTVTARNPTT